MTMSFPFRTQLEKLKAPRLSIRRLLLLIIGGLTLMIVLLAARELFTNIQRLNRIYQLRDAWALGGQIFSATDTLTIERDISLTMLNAPDDETVADLRPLLREARQQTDATLRSSVTALHASRFPEFVALGAKIQARQSTLRVLRPRVDHALAVPRRQREAGLTQAWSDTSTDLLTEATDVWSGFIRQFTGVDARVTQHLLFRQFLRSIIDATGRERAVIGQIIAENANPTVEQTTALLHDEGELAVSWRMSRLVAQQSGLYDEIGPAFIDAESHFATMHDMTREMFYTPGANNGGVYLIGPDLWFELSSQAADSLGELRTATRDATTANLARLISATERSIALQVMLFLLAAALCTASFWVVTTRVIQPINRIVDALIRATRGERVAFSGGQRDDEIGQLAGVLGAFHENAEETKRTALLLARSQGRLRAVVDYAADGVITLDAANCITSFNPACERLFGFTAAEMVGQHFRALTPGIYSGHDEELDAYVTPEGTQGNGVPHEVTGRRKDGSTFPVDLTVSGFTLEDGKNYCAIIRDITLRKRSEKTLLSYTHALERSNKELDDFAYIASHDLKEPLRGIHNHSRFLMEDNAEKLDEESKGRLTRLIYLSQRMEKLVNDLLYFSRLGRQEMAIQRTELSPVIDDIAGTLEHFLEEKNAKIVMPRPLPEIVCDRTRVSELFRNLITNAIKYNDKPERTVEIGFLETGLGSNGAPIRNVFYVKDDGCGIDPEFHQEIFRIFRRLKGNKEEGTGVGLTFVKKIVERHGGQIWLDSEIGRGTTFYFTLEAQKDDASISTRAA